MPTLSGFLVFIRTVMGVPVSALPDDSVDIANALAVALEIANTGLNEVSSLIYTLAVYNLAGDNLINYANDQVGQTYFAQLRQNWNITGFIAGVISGSSDESTSQTILTPEAMKGLMLADLQNLKTPYGRQYLAFAQSYGSLWGLS